MRVRSLAGGLAALCLFPASAAVAGLADASEPVRLEHQPVADSLAAARATPSATPVGAMPMLALVKGEVGHGLGLEDPPPPPPPESYDSFFDGWTGSVDAGLNGSAGNTEVFNVRLGASAKRTLKAYETTGSLLYSRSTESGETTKNRFEAFLRNDWNLGDTPWIIWAQGRAEYDDFQDWDWRLQAQAGLGYKFIKNDRTTLIGRVGAGVTKEIGGSRNELIPEGVLGVDFSHQLTERQKFTFTGEYYPSLSDFPQYRALARAAYEILVDPEVKMFLKLGAELRYQSSPGPSRKRADVDYFLTLGWAF